MTTSTDAVVVDTPAPLGQYAKYVKPRLLKDPEFREQYIKASVEKYMRRYSTDVAFKKQADEKAKLKMRAKYHEDPEYRARKLEYARNYREKQKALKYSSSSIV